jgi:hypothetical protein
VLGEFAAHGGEARVYAATAWPLNWSEEEALELLHDDTAYEFQIGWSLWELETVTDVDPRWAREPRLVRVTGYGPLFCEGAYEQDGHIRLDFGSGCAIP